jgi:hypothetical protein
MLKQTILDNINEEIGQLADPTTLDDERKYNSISEKIGELSEEDKKGIALLDNLILNIKNF